LNRTGIANYPWLLRLFALEQLLTPGGTVASIINSQPDMLLVEQASTGRQAIEYFRKHQADVILMDDSVPDMSGIEVMIAIRAEFPEARFIILTGFARDNEIRQALAKGANAYILTSMPSSELVDV
jgi:DNA-binding NarL/FixJ family response regulator